MIQTRFEGANRAHRKANNLIFQSYVYVLYPMSAVAFCASIYMTLAVTVERRVNNFLTFPYKTCCKTHQKRGEQPVSDETFSMRNWLEEKSWEVLVNSLNRSYITSCSHVFGCDSSPRSPNVMLCYVRSARSHEDFDRELSSPISLSTWYLCIRE